MKLSTRTEGQLQIISVMEDRIDAAVPRGLKRSERDLVEHAAACRYSGLAQYRLLIPAGLGRFVATLNETIAPGPVSCRWLGLTPAVRTGCFGLRGWTASFPLFPTMYAAMPARATA